MEVCILFWRLLTCLQFEILNLNMKRDNLGYDYLAKILIIGDSGVGKTNILLRFCQNNFLTSHLSTIGIDFKIKTIEIDNKKIRLQIWDTAGQERFKTITQTYYKGSMGIVMTYSVSDLNSFHAMENWLKQIKMHASQNVVKILVANKCDVSDADRKVTYNQGKAMADQFGVSFFEVSAKENKNIAETFDYMARTIKTQILSDEVPIQTRSFTYSKPLVTGEKAKKKNCC